MHCHDELHGKWSCLALVASRRVHFAAVHSWILYISCCLFMHRFVETAIAWLWMLAHFTQWILHRCSPSFTSFVRLLAISVCLLSSSRFLSLHSNLIVFFFSLRYAGSTTLNYRKLHIFSLFPYWMVSVMSLLFPFRSILHTFFGRSVSFVSFRFVALPLTVLTDCLTPYEYTSLVLFFSLLPYLF